MNSSLKPNHKNKFTRIIFFLVILFFYIPLLLVAFQSFLEDPNRWDSSFTLKWIMRLFQDSSLWLPLLNSIEIALASATISVLLGIIGAVGFSSSKEKTSSIVQGLIFLPILLPEIITGLSLLLFFLFLHLELGFFTVILAHASFSTSFAYFIILEQLKSLNPNLAEAAYDLGATSMQVFWKVTFPNILPGVFAAWLLAFTLSFDDFLISFFVSGAGVTTLPLKIYSMMKIGLSPEINALGFILIVISTSLVLLLISKEQSKKWVLKG